jgi:predicted transcriptional regulator
MKRRTDWEIVLDILRVVQEKRKVHKTRIMQGTYLDSRAFQKYFHYLLNKSLITKCNTDFEFYELTENGKGALGKFMEVDKLMYHFRTENNMRGEITLSPR